VLFGGLRESGGRVLGVPGNRLLVPDGKTLASSKPSKGANGFGRATFPAGAGNTGLAFDDYEAPSFRPTASAWHFRKPPRQHRNLFGDSGGQDLRQITRRGLSLVTDLPGRRMELAGLQRGDGQTHQIYLCHPDGTGQRQVRPSGLQQCHAGVFVKARKSFFCPTRWAPISG